MSWTRAYRLALHLLPAGLRRKHGSAMEILFARELRRARERGRLEGTLAGAAGVWDVIRRGAYEQLRPGREAADERRDHTPWEWWNMDARGPQPAGANLGGPHVPQYTTRQLLRRHAVSFAIAFVALTASMLALFARKQLPALSARGAPAGTIAEALLLAVPFIAAMTIPMAVLIAVLRNFTRFSAEGTLAVARRERDGVRRLVMPVLLAATGVAALALVVTATIVPRANQRLAAVMAGGTVPSSGRTMTIAELREAARSIRPATGPVALARTAAYEVEVQKKFALAAACVVMALAGVAIALRVPRGGAALVIGASCVVFGAYYELMVIGEDLADRLVVSPFTGMWWANALLLAAALMLAVWRRPVHLMPGGSRRWLPGAKRHWVTPS
ncbi:MAG TPA: LptF/LptG family permease [Gemmatimonadaceae bacterium]|nr:LptF/LptG family permease [Gemmatimonadaceae bacterium]